MKNKIERAYAVANNAIYFDDSSDYATTLYEVCKILKPDVEDDLIGNRYIECKKGCKINNHKKMEYIHPKHYKGLKFDTPHNQLIRRAYVERYCLFCDKFMGKEHDFSECRLHDKTEYGKVVEYKTCPFEWAAVPLIHPEIAIKCKVEGEE